MTKLTQIKFDSMKIKPIKSRKDYNNALKRLEVIFDALPGTPQGDELEVLGILVHNYENEHFPIDLPDPIEAIKFRMEQLGYNQNDLAKQIGLKSRAIMKMNISLLIYLILFRQLHK